MTFLLCDPGCYVHKPAFFCAFPVHSGHQVRWTYRPESHRRKSTQDFLSTFLLRCVPYFFSREGFSHSFPSSIAKSIFCVLTISPLVVFVLFCFFSEKNLVYRDRTHVPTCQKVTRLPLSYRGDRLDVQNKWDGNTVKQTQYNYVLDFFFFISLSFYFFQISDSSWCRDNRIHVM